MKNVLQDAVERIAYRSDVEEVAEVEQVKPSRYERSVSAKYGRSKQN